jgi:hypothetical protein
MLQEHRLMSAQTTRQVQAMDAAFGEEKLQRHLEVSETIALASPVQKVHTDQLLPQMDIRLSELKAEERTLLCVCAVRSLP